MNKMTKKVQQPVLACLWVLIIIITAEIYDVIDHLAILVAE
jgi:hypothetical protein